MEWWYNMVELLQLFISNKVWDSQLVKADMNSRQSDHLAWEYINL